MPRKNNVALVRLADLRSAAASTRYGTNPNKADTDGDGISDKDELFVYFSNPRIDDTDGDRYSYLNYNYYYCRYYGDTDYL